MWVIKVVPIIRGVSKEHLSYFTSLDIPLGSIVKVPVRKKIVNGLVVAKENASDIKSEIKKSAFAIKKIEKLSAIKIFSPEFIKSVEKTAEYFASSSGAVLNQLVPKAILDNAEKISLEIVDHEIYGSHQKLALQADDDERFANYKSLIREEFARKSSVFFCVPSVGDVQKAKSGLEKGIEPYTFVLHSSLRTAEVLAVWNKILHERHPVLIIATGPYLSVPRPDIKTIILERENSRSYKTQSRPFLDVRTFAEYLARETKARIIFGDAMLRTETLWRHQNDEIAELNPLKFRLVSTATQEMIDMKRPVGLENVEFKIFSGELEALIRSNKENSEHLFMFAVRRGLSPTTICADCGQIVVCKNCKAPTVLHGGSDNFFLCHRCGEKRDAKEYCGNCQSWKLTTLGIGIETVEQELKKKFPDVKTFLIDKDSVTTHKQAQKVVEEFYAAPGSILIGTEMALSYLNERIENSAVVSIDSLFSIPDFRITEKIMYILLKIRSIANKKFLLQTRNIGQKTLEYATRGNLIDFYREEIEGRKTFEYPPYSVLIKISLQGQKQAVQEEMKKVEELFGADVISVFPAFAALAKGKYTMHGLIKIAPERWVDKEILAKLMSLPAQFVIKVDPESLL